jgi:hypothetical protein
VADGEGFDRTAEYLVDVAATLDMIYGNKQVGERA